MDSKLKLDSSLEEFKKVVNRLLEHPSLDSALGTNIASLGLGDLFYEANTDFKKDSIGAAKEYIRLIDLCLYEFQKMIPQMNGESWHIDLYREQMDGRKDLVKKAVLYSDYFRNN